MSRNRRAQKSADSTGNGHLRQTTSNYYLVRPASRLETLYKLFNELKCQSAIIVACTYSHRDSRLLDKPSLFRALRVVIEQHPILAMVTHTEKAENGDHRAWMARLKSINLSDCVSFIDDYKSSSPGLQHLLEKAHNEWFDTNDKTKPLFRLVVVNRTHVLYVFQHFVSDGVSGVNFHRSLISALNTLPTDDQNTFNSSPRLDSLMVSVPEITSYPQGSQILEEHFSWFMVIRAAVLALYLIILRKLLPRKAFVFSDATFERSIPHPSNPPQEYARTITKVQSLHLSPETLARCLAACKKNNSTFTAFLHTILCVTLAVDLYPDAKIAFSGTQVDLRRFVSAEIVKKYSLDLDLGMMNLASSLYCRTWLKDFREAGISQDQTSTSSSSSQSTSTMSPGKFWLVAQKYKENVSGSLALPRTQTPAVVQDLLSLKLMPAEEEPLAKQLFSAMALINENSFSFSNLGSFPNESTIDGKWKISGMEFSAGAVKAPVGPTVYIGVASVKGGACVLNFVYEKGVLEDEIITRLIEGLQKRIHVLVD